jgi:hypothetical protein
MVEMSKLLIEVARETIQVLHLIHSSSGPLH